MATQDNFRRNCDARDPQIYHANGRLEVWFEGNCFKSFAELAEAVDNLNVAREIYITNEKLYI